MTFKITDMCCEKSKKISCLISDISILLDGLPYSLINSVNSFLQFPCIIDTTQYRGIFHVIQTAENYLSYAISTAFNIQTDLH